MENSFTMRNTVDDIFPRRFRNRDYPDHHQEPDPEEAL